jgi:hypothetical protein
MIRLSHSESVAIKVATWITGIPETIDNDVEGLLVPPRLERNMRRLAEKLCVRLATRLGGIYRAGTCCTGLGRIFATIIIAAARRRGTRISVLSRR